MSRLTDKPEKRGKEIKTKCSLRKVEKNILVVVVVVLTKQRKEKKKRNNKVLLQA